jgi:hypothetical protein
MIAQVSSIKYFSLNFFHTLPSDPINLNAVELNDPRVVLTGSGEPEGRRRPQAIPSPGVEMGSWQKDWGGKRNGWIEGNLSLSKFFKDSD